MARRLRQMYAEFKEFAFKGNMIDLAVAVVLGAAFSGVVNALVKDIIMPAISYVTTAASEAKNAATHVASSVGLTSTTQPAAATQPAAEAKAPPPAPPPAAPAKADNKPVDFSWRVGRFEVGNFIGEIINFILVAFAVFIFVVKFLGSVMKKVHRSKDPDEPTTKECPRCLSTVPYLATKCAHCTVDLEAPPATPPAAVPQG